MRNNLIPAESGSVPVIPVILGLGATVLCIYRFLEGAWPWEQFSFSADGPPFLVRKRESWGDVYVQYEDPFDKRSMY